VVPLTGLDPGTKYFYSVGTWSVPVAGGDSFYFVTAPTNTQPTRMWVIGDSGIQDERPQRVFAAYTNFTGARRTDVWLLLGDNAYPNGTDKQYQTAVFERFPGLLRQTPAWTTIGNHETYSRSADGFPYLGIFSPPRNGEAGGVASGTPRYYSFDHGNIHFVCLDAMTSDRTTNGAMYAWLREDLAAHDREWLIAFWHHPPYTKGSHNSDSERELMQMRQNFVPLLESYGVDLVLCGHSHCYERSFFMQGHYGLSRTFTESMKVQPGSGREDDTGAYLKPNLGPEASPGTVYVVAGSSGHAVGGKLNHPAMFFSELQLGSLVIDIDGPVLRAQFLRETGAIDDSFAIIKGASAVAHQLVSRPLPSRETIFTWPAKPGWRHQVQRATTLSPPDWLPVSSPLEATGATIEWRVAITTEQPQAYYRIIYLPE
jgi:3',5'-cyclic AMP phosphodiesterase CpdA